MRTGRYPRFQFHNAVRLLVVTTYLTTASMAAAQEREGVFAPSGGIFDGWFTSTDGEISDTVVTDRPDFTEASSTVGTGIAQLETGYTFVYDDEAGERLEGHSAPETLLRLGLTDHVELRLFWNYLWETTSGAAGTSSRDGATDFSIGTKLDMWKQVCFVPEMAVVVAMTVPTGGRGFTSQDVQAGVNWLYSWELAGGFSLGGSTGYTTASELIEVPAPIVGTIEVPDDHNLFNQSIALGIPLTDVLGMYIEYFGLFTDGRVSDTPANFANGGFTLLTSPDVQLDWRAGVGLNSSADDFFTGAGITIRR